MATRTPRTPRTPGAEQAAAAEEAAAAEGMVETAPDESVTGDMPNAIDIDATKITGPVLTKQGWVCPAEQPRRGNF